MDNEIGPHKEDMAARELTIRDLYPDFNEKQLKQAEENLDAYLEVVLRIYDRIQSDPETHSQFRALTASGGTATMMTERSNPSKDLTSKKTS